jgi:hypothetical protein
MKHLLECTHLSDLVQRAFSSGTQRTVRKAAVGISINGVRAYAAAGELSGILDSEIANINTKLGCLAKLLTTTIAAQRVAAGDLRWDQPVSEMLCDSVRVSETLANITFRELLTHTHGLDDACFSGTHAPRLTDGRVDITAICNRLASYTPLAKPGGLYNHGNSGAWICAAVLERLADKSFGELLVKQLLAPIGLSDVIECDPANERHLELSLSTALAFLELHIGHRRCTEPLVWPFVATELASNPLSLPGWSATERGVCLGWKYYGDNWYGHNAEMEEYSAAWRINADAKIAIAFAGHGDQAFMMFAKIFSGLLPEFSSVQKLTLVRDDGSKPANLCEYEGDYLNSAISVKCRIVERQLVYELERQRQASVDAVAVAHVTTPVGNDMFLPRGRGAEELPFIQFLRTVPGQPFQYLWNGRNLLRRRDLRESPPLPCADRFADLVNAEDFHLDKLMGRC